MCGIVGYAGRRQAVGILLDGLQRLEYRGYDSAGVVVLNGHGLICEKRTGKIADLEAGIGKRALKGRTGLGHTRWATHGTVSVANAHPHLSCDGKIAVVHNGIIENHAELRDELEKHHRFQSGTDTEVIPHLIESLYEQTGGDILRAVNMAVDRLKGSLAIGVMHGEHPNCICVARINCPLVLGFGDGENFLASDIPALLPYTRHIVPLEENEIAKITPSGVQIFDREFRPKSPRRLEITWTSESAEKKGHAHFMAQEIASQSATVAAEVEAWDQEEQSVRIPRDVDRVAVVACGSAWHAGLVAKVAMEELARIPVDVGLASEVRYGDYPFGKKTLTLAISQSGETADTLASADRQKAARPCSPSPTSGSTLSREADQVIYMQSGPKSAWPPPRPTRPSW
jgi:glucosamine--fructose-6-phosphate aminotransferase (isomerizing)